MEGELRDHYRVDDHHHHRFGRFIVHSLWHDWESLPFFFYLYLILTNELVTVSIRFISYIIYLYYYVLLPPYIYEDIRQLMSDIIFQLVTFISLWTIILANYPLFNNDCAFHFTNINRGNFYLFSLFHFQISSFFP